MPWLSRIGALALTALAAACAPTAPPGILKPATAPLVDQIAAVDPPVPGRYTIGVGDQLDLHFPFRPEFDSTETVRPDGRISAPLLGSVPAVGETPDQVTQLLRASYRERSASIPPPSRRVYLIQAGDVLDVKFTDARDLNDQAVVRPDGRISLAIIGSVIAEGRTPENLGREISALYAQHITQADLVVIVRSMANKQFVVGGRVENSPIAGLEEVAVVVRSFPPPRVYVGGEVERPGEQPFSGKVSLLQSIISAGGATSSGEMRSVAVVRRTDDGQPLVLVVNLATDLQGALSSDVPLRPFDVVYVPKTQIANVQDFLDQYLYRLVPALRNSSVGFSYIVTNQTNTP